MANGDCGKGSCSALVVDLTNRLMAQASDEEKNSLRTSLLTRMDPQQARQHQAQGIDPVFLSYRMHAINLFSPGEADSASTAKAATRATNEHSWWSAHVAATVDGYTIEINERLASRANILCLSNPIFRVLGNHYFDFSKPLLKEHLILLNSVKVYCLDSSPLT